MTFCTRECPPDCLKEKLDMTAEIGKLKRYGRSLINANERLGDEIDALRKENRILREGMQGDYDLDAWLEWVKKFEVDPHPNQSIGEQIERDK